MKYYLIGLFFSFIFGVSSTLAIECDDMRKDILALEYKIQNSSLAKCSDASHGGICCREGDPQSCKTKQELDKEYNKALAELIIAEGIQSLGLSLEGNHNAINDIRAEDIDKAVGYVQDMNQSLNKAELLYDALNFKADPIKNEDTSIFSEYKGSTQQEVSLYLWDKCQNSIFKDEAFCTKMKELNTSNIDSYHDLMNTMSGFLNSDKQINNSDRERRPRYQSYQDRLMIQKDGTNFNPENFKGTDHFKSLNELSGLLKELQKKRKSTEPTKELAEKILTLAGSIEDISVNYNLDSAGGATPNPEVTSFIKSSFDNVLNQLDLPGMVLEGGVKDNFKNTSKKLINEVKLHKNSFQKKLAPFLENIRNENLDGQSVAEWCNNSFDTQCLRILCGESSVSKPNTCANFANFDMNSYYQELKELDDHQETSGVLLDAQSCLEKDISLLEKKECLQNLPVDHQTPLSQLRENLANARKALQYINNGPVFKKLNGQKAMALDALNSNYCRFTGDTALIDPSYGDCRPNEQIGEDYTVLNLALNAGEAMINLNHDLFKDVLNKEVSTPKMNELKKELLEDCANGKAKDLEQICYYYQDKIAWKERWEEEKQARKNEIVINDKPYVEEDPYTVWDAGAVMGRVFLGSLTPLTIAWLETDYVKTQTNYQINAINNYNDAYMTSLNNYYSTLDYYNSLDPVTVNYGYANTGFTYGDYSTFQSGVSNSVFTNPITNFTFNGIPSTVATQDV